MIKIKRDNGLFIKGHKEACGKANGRYSHGMVGTKIYMVWQNMKARCDNKNHPKYKIWGGRGIVYCPEWEKFESFYADMKEGYSEELSIDRINNDGNYCKENCRWATPEEQINNKSNNVFLEFKGKRQTLTKWAKEIKMPKTTLWQRIRYRGWSIEKSLTTPARLKLQNEST